MAEKQTENNDFEEMLISGAVTDFNELYELGLFHENDNPLLAFKCFKKATEINEYLLRAWKKLAYFYEYGIKGELGVDKEKATTTDSIISSIAMFLNVMVFASIFSTIINSDFKFAGIENFGIWILIIGCVLSLLCMRTIAGYVFFIFLIFAIMRLIDINSAMGFCGALYIVFIGISVFLQIPDLKDFSNLLQEFKGTAKSTGSRVVEDMNLAKNDATEKIENIKIKVKTKMDERKNKLG